ncbi:MAG: hypothetical protein JNN13_01165 [Planctomycetes bacterium]|nr:hypothetical protein [Planctomycetota bacterium]
MQNGVVSLWQLLEAGRAGGPEFERASVAAEHSLATSASPGSLFVCLQVVAGALQVDGVAVPLDARMLPAVRGLLAALQGAHITTLRISREVRAEALVVAARRLLRIVPDRDDEPWPAGIEVQREHDEAAADEPPPLPLQRGVEPHDLPDSRLQAVFLQHRLVAGLRRIPGLDPAVGKVAVQAVVERLLSTPGGLEPLMLLQQDPARLSRATAAAVLASAFGRVLGWPEHRLAELGVAALLQGVGEVLDEAHPGPAAFVWLLQRGADDLWLRAALVARGVDDALGAAIPAALARVAGDVLTALDRGALDLGAALAAAPPTGEPELLDVLRAAFAGAA